MDAIITMLIDYGALALFAILYYILFRWTLKRFEKTEERYEKIITDSAEREKSYQAIIGTLSNELPAMRETLARIETKVT